MRITSGTTALFELSISFRLEGATLPALRASCARIGGAPLTASHTELDENDARSWEWAHSEPTAPWPGRYARVFVRQWPEKNELLAKLDATFDSIALAPACRALGVLLDDAKGRLVDPSLWLNGDGVYASGPTVKRALLQRLLADAADVTIDAAFDAQWPTRVLSFTIDEDRATSCFTLRRPTERVPS